MSVENKTRCNYILKNNVQCKRLCNKEYCWQHSDIIFKRQSDSVICNNTYDYTFEKIGFGSYGTVYKYKDLIYKESNIIDTYDYGLDLTNIREICFLSQFSHNSISQLQCVNKIDYNNLSEDDKYKIYMKYRGKTLFKHFSEYKDIYLKYIIYQLLLLLNSLYENHIIHGDIKPDNITVDSDFNVYLIDWGSVNVYSKYDTITNCTYLYDAPEADYLNGRFVNGRFVDGINDIYRLGMSILNLYDSNLLSFSYKYLKAYYTNSENIRLDTNNITNPEIKKIIDMMITINYKNRPYASELLKDPIFDIYRNSNIYNSQKINKYKLKIKPFKYYSSDISDLNIYDKKNILVSEKNIIRFRKDTLEWIWESYLYVDDGMKYLNLYLHTCTLIDNYLAFNIVNTQNLEMICTACMFISIMFYASSDTTKMLIKNSQFYFTKDQLNSTVIKILQFFDYKIYINTPDLSYNYEKPYIKDPLYIKLRELVVKPESFGIIHIFNQL
jgi:serine/threonine protein kinase